MNFILLFVVIQILILMVFNIKYFWKTKDYMVFVPTMLQGIVATIAIHAIWFQTILSSTFEIGILLLGILLPVLYLMVDKPMLKKQVLFRRNKINNKQKIATLNPVLNTNHEVAPIIGDKEVTKLMGSVSAKEVFQKLRLSVKNVQKFLRKNEYAEALKEYLVMEPFFQNADYFFNLGNVYYHLGNYGEAKQQYQKALEILKTKGSKREKKHAHAKSVDRLTAEEVRCNLATANYMLGEYCEAMMQYEQVMHSDPESKMGVDNYIYVLLKLKNFDKAVHYCHALAEKFPNSRYQFLLAKIYYELNQLDSCKQHLESAIERDSDHVDSLVLLAEVYASTDQLDKAVQLYKKLKKLTPNDYAVHYSLGKLLVSKNDYQGALECFNFAYHLNNSMFEALYNVGLMHEKKEQLTEAIEVYKELIKIKPNFLVAYTRLWTLYSKEQKFDEIIQIFHQGLKESPREYVFHFYLGVAYSKIEQYPEALDAFKNVLDINPEIKEVNFYLGIILTKLEKYEEAIHTFRNALLDAPEDNEVFYNMSITYCMQERYDKALATLKRAIELNPNTKEKLLDNEVFACLENYEDFKMMAG